MKNFVIFAIMKRKTAIKLIIILLVLNLLLPVFNLFINVQQSESIKFNERLYDVFLDNYYER